MRQKLKLSVVFCWIILFTSSAFSQTSTDVFKKALSLQYSAPRAAINDLVAQKNNINSTSDSEFFQHHRLLFLLYQKIGQLTLADETLQVMEQRLNHTEDYQSWLVIFRASLLLSQLKTKEAKALIQTLTKNITLEDSPQLTMWFKFVQGSLETRQYLYEHAMSNLNSALGHARKLNDKTIEMSVLGQLVNIYYYMTKYEKALEANNELLEIARSLNDSFFEVFALSNQMNTYYMMGLTYDKVIAETENETKKQEAVNLKQEYTDKAAQLTELVLQKSRAINAFKIELRALISLQNKYMGSGDNDKAIELSNQAILLAEKNNQDYEKAVSYNNLAISYRAIKQHEKGLAALKQAEIIYREIDEPQSLLWVLEDYSIAYEINQQFEEALEYRKQYHEASLALLNKTNGEKVIELQEVFQNEKNVNEIQRLNLKNTLSQAELNVKDQQQIMFIGLGGILMIFLYFVYNRSRVISANNAKLDELNKKLKEQAIRDPLTGLYNRRLLSEIEKKISSTCIRRFRDEPEEKLKIGLVLFDIDNFKKINDTYGHDAGDIVIQNISEELVANLRDGDIAIRWGGEEFLVVLFDTQEAGIKQFCQRMIDLRNESEMQVNQHKIKVTSSIGYQLFPYSATNPDWFTWDESLKLIDNYLYLAKHGGRNRAVTVTVDEDIINDATKTLLLSTINQEGCEIPAGVHVEVIRSQL